MATNRIEASSSAERRNEDSTDAPSQTKPAVPSGLGGFKPWLPLIANIVLMPALAYLMTTAVLMPKLKAGGQTDNGNGGGASGGSSAGRNPSTGKTEVNVALNGKVLVNVSGTMGARYLLANITLVGTSLDLKSVVEKSDAQLRDVAASVLAGKTISDLDKPGARNLLRTELVSAFNNVLGNGTVTGILFTEFAIQ